MMDTINLIIASEKNAEEIKNQAALKARAIIKDASDNARILMDKERVNSDNEAQKIVLDAESAAAALIADAENKADTLAQNALENSRNKIEAAAVFIAERIVSGL